MNDNPFVLRKQRAAFRALRPGQRVKVTWRLSHASDSGNRYEERVSEGVVTENRREGKTLVIRDSQKVHHMVFDICVLEVTELEAE